MRLLVMTAVFVLIAMIGGYAEVADLRIQNERVESNVFKFDVAIQRTDEWAGDGLGHADFYFTYNDAALSDNPGVTNLHPAINGNTAYQVSAQVNGGLLHVKVDFTNGGGLPWLPGLNLAEQVCTVELDIIDGSQQSEVKWDKLNTGVLTTDFTVMQETFVGSGDVSLPVELSLFCADYVNGAVEIKWRTESEFNNWGFYIYRSTIENGTYERRNPSLIKGAGYSAGTRNYTFVDERVEKNTVYFYVLEEVDIDGHSRRYAPVRVQTGDIHVAAVEEYELEQNYPNPFNPQTTISFTLPHSEYVELLLYNIDGRLVKIIVNDVLVSGHHNVVWDGLDSEGRRAPSGSYLYKLRTLSFSQSKMLTLVR